MTRQEAIRWIQLDIDMAKFDPSTGEEAYLNDDARKVIEAQEMAIEALKASDPDINVGNKDLIDRQAAIDALMARDKKLRNINWYDKPYAEIECRGIDEALAIISNMPSAQPEQTDCCYCHEDFDKYVKPIEKNGHAYIYFGMNGWCLELRAKGWHGEAKINYCPMCGRKLKHG